MEERHEIIQFDSSSPIKLFMHKLGDVSRHWHESLELLFVLTGNATVLVNDTQTTLTQDNVLLINSNTPHELHAEECVLIAIQIKLSKFRLPRELSQDLYFDCNSTQGSDPHKFLRIKQLIATMVQSNAVQDDTTPFHNRSLAYALLSELVQNFKVEPPARDPNTQKHMERLADIVQYINDHYQEQLSLTQVAEYAHLSPPYLSSFFEKYMGVNFSTYYTALRLDHAIQELLYSDIPVEQIALNCGFSDPRSFVRAFKKKYDMVPSAYRKRSSPPSQSKSDDSLLAINYLNFKQENYLHILTQYLSEHTDVAPPHRASTKDYTIGTVDCSQSKGTLEHKWRTFIGVGRAKELLYAGVQNMLTTLQQQIGFRYVRFHGLLSDDMLVCRRESDGSLRFSFVLVDQVLDFLLSIGLKPLVQFSFMPAALAQRTSNTVFASPFIISPPQEMREWNQLITAFLEHILARYGQEEIRSWLYSVWNEPDTSSQMFGFDSAEQFYDLYKNTYQTTKAFDPELMFGSPSLFPIHDSSAAWFKNYLEFSAEQGCIPNFLDIHYYSDDFSQLNYRNATFSNGCPISADPDNFGYFISSIQTFLETMGVSHLPLYITEWNLTVSHNNLINDTCFKGCYLAKNYLENYDRTDAIGYWSLTDLIEEHQPDPRLFHGGMGLFTRNGIKKPPYYAMQMLRQLGDTLVASGDGYFITRQGDDLHIVLYNYEHCDPLFTAEGFGLTDTQRDGVFPLRSALNVSLSLYNLSADSYRVRETILNQEHGSCFDLWVTMGGTELTREETDWLRRNSEPALRCYNVTPINGEIPYSATLAPQEVRLIEFSRRYS